MTYCPNCTAPHPVPVYRRDRVITYQNVVLSSLEEAHQVPQGVLDLFFCEKCTFLYNKAYEETLVGYGESYENDQTHSLLFRNHVTQLAEKILHKNHKTHHRLLEIGCGNGSFLRRLVGEDNQNEGVGFDKSLKASFQEPRLSFYKKYYSEEDEGDFHVVLSRHVVEHILDNNNVLSLLKKKNPHAQFFIETPSLEWIVENKAFFDIFYEHCSYFSAFSLYQLLKRQGIPVRSLEGVFHDQYLWIESGEEGTSPPVPTLTLSHLQEFFQGFQSLIDFYQNWLQERALKGPVVLWGAGAKGVTFAHLVDPHQEILQGVIDINPHKIGHFLPGTGHPILSPQWLSEERGLQSSLLQKPIKTVMIMNPNYEAEITSAFKGQNIEFFVLKEEKNESSLHHRRSEPSSSNRRRGNGSLLA